MLRNPFGIKCGQSSDSACAGCGGGCAWSRNAGGAVPTVRAGSVPRSAGVASVVRPSTAVGKRRHRSPPGDPPLRHRVQRAGDLLAPVFHHVPVDHCRLHIAVAGEVPAPCECSHRPPASRWRSCAAAHASSPASAPSATELCGAGVYSQIPQNDHLVRRLQALRKVVLREATPASREMTRRP